MFDERFIHAGCRRQTMDFQNNNKLLNAYVSYLLKRKNEGKKKISKKICWITVKLLEKKILKNTNNQYLTNINQY